jgi:hypothetical protein
MEGGFPLLGDAFPEMKAQTTAAGASRKGNEHRSGHLDRRPETDLACRALVPAGARPEHGRDRPDGEGSQA